MSCAAAADALGLLPSADPFAAAVAAVAAAAVVVAGVAVVAVLVLVVVVVLLLVAVLVMVLLLVLMLLMLPCRKHVHYGCATQHHHYRKHVHTVCLLPTSLRTSTTTIAPIPPILMTTGACC